MNKLKIYISILCFLPAMTMVAQENPTDSLTIGSIMQEMIEHYPVLKKSEQDLVAVDAKMGLTKTAYLPDISLTGSYARIGPTSSITMPINGENHTFELYPPDPYSAAININQSIYDFGKTSKNLELDKKNKEMLLLTVEQTKQRLSMSVAACYYNINFLEEAIGIRNEQLKTLQEHLAFVQKKADTGSATRYDIITTQVRISVIENQITDLETSLQVQSAQLNSYLGRNVESPVLVKRTVFEKSLIAPVDTLCQEAYNNRNEMKISKQKEEISKSKLDIVKVQNNPSLNLSASGGFKNGYLNDQLQDTGKLNYTVGVGVKVPLFDANRSKYTKIQAQAELEGNKEDTELTKRNIANEVIENRAQALSALKKVNQSELQLRQAQQAYELAEVNYSAGAITNLDLLDSYTSLADSKLTLYKSRIDYQLNLQKLKISVGEKIY